MLDAHLFGLFLAAATLLAITPGPGMFYVLSRSLTGGRGEGFLSAAGTFVGGLVHVAAAAVGISAIIATSALAFASIKYVGALYLVYLGVGLIRSRNLPIEEVSQVVRPGPTFRQGVLTEVLNPKTALFFLSFIPQFVNPQLGKLMLQFLVLGFLSVTLNTIADLAVVCFSAPIGIRLKSSARFRRHQRVISGTAMIGLGAFLCFGESKHDAHS
jgi:threonine/homoserine/homoserine lactone efflux protein